jgi:hypothetical protein
MMKIYEPNPTMITIYDPKLNAYVTLDDERRVRAILHSQEYWLSDDNRPGAAAVQYLRRMSEVLKIPIEQLDHLQERVTYVEPREQGIEYRLSEENQVFDSTTLSYYQTNLNVPVWGGGLSVTIKQNPSRIVHSMNTSQEDIDAKLPSQAAIERYLELFRRVELAQCASVPGESIEDRATARILRKLLGLRAKRAAGGRTRKSAKQTTEDLRINRGRFFVYQYSERNRQPPSSSDSVGTGAKTGEVIEQDDVQPTLPLPPVPSEIEDGHYYLVAEILFTLVTPQWGRLNWHALVEVETDTILYLRALIAGVKGKVFKYDPITSTGVIANTANKSNANLDGFSSHEDLFNLNAPGVGSRQSLVGSKVQVIDDDLPAVVPPTEPTGTDFDFDVRTNDFAAVNAYYHADQVFEMIEDLGFPLNTYFPGPAPSGPPCSGTTFPVHIDHRARKPNGNPNGEDIYAFMHANCTNDGIGFVGFCLGDLSDITHPLGRAVDKWAHWHEIGGHGILLARIHSLNFNFAHSVGDGLAAIQIDPESKLRSVPLRFQYAPFLPGTNRDFNKDVTIGWAWGGIFDRGMAINEGYDSEQILATTHFRIYRSVGGDAANVASCQFASRVVTYLILRAVYGLTQSTNPSTADLWCGALMAADLLDWTTAGLSGGAYNKVIRWAFEKQGMFQSPGAPTPVTSVGAPPDVDIYIDDGRHGEYEYKYDHWNNTSIWNRNNADGMTGHQPAIVGQTNYAYVKVKNRGTLTANNVIVKGYHCLPGAGLTWPTDFLQMTPLAGLPIASIAANNTQEVTVGPFAWIPNVNAYGHDCLLMIASTAGDVSNIDNFALGETIEEWRLVPHDNNVGQRNVQLVPGGGGGQGLIAGLDRHIFYAGNTFRRHTTMELKAVLPAFLSERGWRIELKPNIFKLESGQKRQIVIELVPGGEFTSEQVRNSVERDITVSLYANDMLLGGMTYRLDPEMKSL